MKTWRKILLSSFCLIGTTCVAATTASYNVIPQPQEVKLTSEAPFILHDNVEIAYSGNTDMKRCADFLAEYIKENTGIQLKVTDNTNDAEKIVLKCDLADNNKEAYKITISQKGIEINGASAAGVFHGVQTLRKAVPVEESDKVSLPAGNVYDYPRFEYRGTMLDVSRHFFSVDEVKTFIDMCAMHNLNNFHWHLSEDQGWRIEIKKYPKLTEIGSMRKETVIGRNPGKWDGKPYGGFYTQEQAKEIVKYAADRFINVVPEIDMPGHMRAALAAYPELGCTGGPYDVWTQWGVSEEVLCAGNDKTLQFIKDVLNEIMDIFPSQYIHVGGDECPKTRWEKCPKCQARIAAEGIKAKNGFSAEMMLQAYVTNFAYNVVKSRGRTMIGWDEILEGDIPQDAIVMSWRGSAGAIDGAKRGNKVILTPNTHLYFDFYQSKDIQFEPFAIGGYTPVEKVYNFEPVPSELKGDRTKYVIGAQANLWTEYIPTFKHVQYMVLPRMAALSEVQWTNPALKDFNSFKNRIPALFRLYDACNYNYAKHLGDVAATYTPNTKDKALDVVFSTLKDNEIYYTLDQSEPTDKSLHYTGPIQIKNSSIIKAVALRNGVKSRILCDTINVNKASFCNIELLQNPAANYTFSGAPLLVDGITGTGNYRTGRWVGFVGNDCEAVIDLGVESKISKVFFNNCIFQCDGVVDSRGVEVYTSKDGKKYKKVASEDYPEIDKTKEFGMVRHDVNFKSSKARYVKVLIKSEKVLPKWHPFANSQGFLFIDEIGVE